MVVGSSKFWATLIKQIKFSLENLTTTFALVHSSDRELMEEGLAFLKNMRSPEFRSGLISLHFVLAVKWLLLVMFEGLLVVSVVLVVLPMFFCVGGAVLSAARRCFSLGLLDVLCFCR